MVIANQQVKTQQLHETKKERKRVHKVTGEVKPSVDGEKEGNEIRHGDYESTPERRETAWNMEWEEN